MNLFHIVSNVEKGVIFSIEKQKDERSHSAVEQSMPNWATISQTENQLLRVNLSDDDYAKQAQQFIDYVNFLLQKELQRITADGQSRADVFWQQNKAMRSTKDSGRYGTRVRLVNACFLAEWYENTFLDRLRNKPISRYIAKGREKNKYPKSAFKKANQAWEKDLIEQVEQQYENLRTQAGVLYDIRKSLKKYQRLINDVYSG